MATMSAVNDAFEAERERLGRAMTIEEIEALDAKLAAGIRELAAAADPIVEETRRRLSGISARLHSILEGAGDSLNMARDLDTLQGLLEDLKRKHDALNLRAAEIRRELEEDPSADSQTHNNLDELLTLLGHPTPPDPEETRVRLAKADGLDHPPRSAPFPDHGKPRKRVSE